MELPGLDVIDDPYRRCHACEQMQHEDWGHACGDCDEWICEPCWRGDWTGRAVDDTGHYWFHFDLWSVA